MNEYDELTALAHQQELERQQWDEWLKQDAAYLKWAEMYDADTIKLRLKHEQEITHGTRRTHPIN